mgnify:CR=1 FL=1
MIRFEVILHKHDQEGEIMALVLVDLKIYFLDFDEANTNNQMLE